MINWLRKIFGIADCEKGIVCLHQDMQKAFNRIEAIELAVGKKRIDHFKDQVSSKHSQRYDEIKRDRKRRKKGH